MKIKNKLFILLIVLALFPIIAIVVGNIVNNERKASYRKNLFHQKKYSTHGAIHLAGEVYKNTEETYTFWDEFVELGIKNKDKSWNDANLYPIIGLQGSDHIWACDLKLNISYHCFDSTKFDIPLPVSANEIYKRIDTIENSHKRYCDFFIKHQNKIIQVFCITVHGSNDAVRLKKPGGFFISTNIVDSAYLDKLKTITASKVEIIADTIQSSSESTEKLIIFEHLTDINDKPVAFLKFTSDISFTKKENQLNLISILILAALFVIVIIISFFYIKKKVSDPVSDIIKSLDTGDKTYIDNLHLQNNEFGELSSVIIESFNQNDEIKIANFELSEKNEELNQQNEELKAISDNLEKNYNELSEINQHLVNANKEISRKNRKINQSIQYALRIQSAAFTSQQILNDVFPANFILFKPKETVSGDLYYFKKIRDYFVIGAIDCTGHGIPGAFMTILGIALLHEIVQNREITQADQVLNTLRAKLISSLGQSRAQIELKEGMDIAFCAINFKTYDMQYAGANLSVYIAKKEQSPTDNHQITVVKGDKLPISIHYKTEQNFTNHEIKLQKNDIVYLFTDGIENQFGGEKGEKFKNKRMIETLSSICNQSMTEQKNSIEQTYNNWKGNNEQIDDILFIGFQC